MHIVTPSEINSVAWEGELITSTTTRTFSLAQPPIVTIGQPEIWSVSDALENEVGQKWVPPMGYDTNYWLVRLACTLRKPSGLQSITEAQKTLYLHPQNSRAGDGTVYAYSLFPERLSIEDKVEFNISLGPQIKFADGSEVKAGELSAKIDYRKVFPVIQSYGAGESRPYWIFKPHAKHPLDGSQFVYAVVVAKGTAGGIRANVLLTVTVETDFGPINLDSQRNPKLVRDLRFRNPEDTRLIGGQPCPNSTKSDLPSTTTARATPPAGWSRILRSQNHFPSSYR